MAVIFQCYYAVIRHEVTDQALPPAAAQLAAGKKRKNMDKLNSEFTVLPSTFGVGFDSVNVKAGTSWVKLSVDHDIKMHRPDPSMYGVHCSLLSD